MSLDQPWRKLAHDLREKHLDEVELAIDAEAAAEKRRAQEESFLKPRPKGASRDPIGMPPREGWQQGDQQDWKEGDQDWKQSDWKRGDFKSHPISGDFSCIEKVLKAKGEFAKQLCCGGDISWKQGDRILADIQSDIMGLCDIKKGGDFKKGSDIKSDIKGGSWQKGKQDESLGFKQQQQQSIPLQSQEKKKAIQQTGA
jgi:hypothetical protein